MVVTPLTQERRRQLTRDTLIDAAADMFARRGIQGASLDEIAAAAGFTKGAIYSNFGGKEELLLAVVEERGDRMLAAMWQAHHASAHDHLHHAAVAASMWRRIVADDEQMQLLRLELRLYAMRNPSIRGRLADLQRKQQHRAAQFLLREAEGANFEFTLPLKRIAGVLIALTEGLLQRAMIDASAADECEAEFEMLLGLLIEAGTRTSTG